MRSRRSFLTLMGLLPGVLAIPARALEFQPYESAAVEKAIGSGKPVVVHVYATWCIHCQAQAKVLDSLKSDPAYDRVTFFRVDYDNQKDVVDKPSVRNIIPLGARVFGAVSLSTWTPPSPYRRREIIQGASDATTGARPMRANARAVLIEALNSHRWLDELLSDPRQTLETLASREGKIERSIRMTVAPRPKVAAMQVRG